MSVKKKPVTHVALILDRSGSMGSIRKEAVGAFNEQLKAIQDSEADGNETYVTLVTFSSIIDKPHYWDVAAQKVPPLTEDNYKPDGGTALLDAMASTIKRLQDLEDADDENTSFLVCTITDGEENSSQEYSRFKGGGKRVGALIEELETTQRWTFTYLCANVDPTKLRDTLSLKTGNVASFVSDSRGTIGASVMHSASTTSYLKGRSKGLTATPTFYSDPAANANPSEDLSNPNSISSVNTKGSPSADLIKPSKAEKPNKLI